MLVTAMFPEWGTSGVTFFLCENLFFPEQTADMSSEHVCQSEFVPTSLFCILSRSNSAFLSRSQLQSCDLHIHRTFPPCLKLRAFLQKLVWKLLFVLHVKVNTSFSTSFFSFDMSQRAIVASTALAVLENSTMKA